MAYENIKKYRCGSCGCEDYKLYGNEDQTMILAECQKCKEKTEIVVTKPKIELRFGEGSVGRMAIF